MSRRCFVWIVGGVAGLIHCGTALLRLDVFFPVPKLRDCFGLFAVLLLAAGMIGALWPLDAEAG